MAMFAPSGVGVAARDTGLVEQVRNFVVEVAGLGETVGILKPGTATETTEHYDATIKKASDEVLREKVHQATPLLVGLVIVGVIVYGARKKRG